MSDRWKGRRLRSRSSPRGIRSGRPEGPSPDADPGLPERDGRRPEGDLRLPADDRADKARWIFLPEGSTIDTRDPDPWEFPVGTKLWKEFSFAGRRVETRLLWRASEDRWVFATYVWNDEQTDARLAPEEGIPGVAEVAPGKRHSIPSTTDCTACHGSGGSVPLGFSALQLSDDRDPNAIHGEPLRPGMITLRTLVEEGVVTPDRNEWVADPPRIRASSPRERAVLGYLHGNCSSCHNPTGPNSEIGMILSHPVTTPPGVAAPALVTTWDRSGPWVVPGLAPGDSRRIAAGAPERSAIVYRMRSRRPSSQMPPLGTVLPDTEAVTLVEGWIREDLLAHPPDQIRHDQLVRSPSAPPESAAIR